MQNLEKRPITLRQFWYVCHKYILAAYNLICPMHVQFSSLLTWALTPEICSVCLSVTASRVSGGDYKSQVGTRETVQRELPSGCNSNTACLCTCLMVGNVTAATTVWDVFMWGDVVTAVCGYCVPYVLEERRSQIKDLVLHCTDLLLDLIQSEVN